MKFSNRDRSTSNIRKVFSHPDTENSTMGHSWQFVGGQSSRLVSNEGGIPRATSKQSRADYPENGNSGTAPDAGHRFPRVTQTSRGGYSNGGKAFAPNGCPKRQVTIDEMSPAELYDPEGDLTPESLQSTEYGPGCRAYSHKGNITPVTTYSPNASIYSPEYLVSGDSRPRRRMSAGNYGSNNILNSSTAYGNPVPHSNHIGRNSSARGEVDEQSIMVRQTTNPSGMGSRRWPGQTAEQFDDSVPFHNQPQRRGFPKQLARLQSASALNGSGLPGRQYGQFDMQSANIDSLNDRSSNGGMDRGGRAAKGMALQDGRAGGLHRQTTCQSIIYTNPRWTQANPKDRTGNNRQPASRGSARRASLSQRMQPRGDAAGPVVDWRGGCQGLVHDDELYDEVSEVGTPPPFTSLNRSLGQFRSRADALSAVDGHNATSHRRDSRSAIFPPPGSQQEHRKASDDRETFWPPNAISHSSANNLATPNTSFGDNRGVGAGGCYPSYNDRSIGLQDNDEPPEFRQPTRRPCGPRQQPAVRWRPKEQESGRIACRPIGDGRQRARRLSLEHGSSIAESGWVGDQLGSVGQRTTQTPRPSGGKGSANLKGNPPPTGCGGGYNRRANFKRGPSGQIREFEDAMVRDRAIGTLEGVWTEEADDVDLDEDMGRLDGPPSAEDEESHDSDSECNSGNPSAEWGQYRPRNHNLRGDDVQDDTLAYDAPRRKEQEKTPNGHILNMSISEVQHNHEDSPSQRGHHRGQLPGSKTRRNAFVGAHDNSLDKLEGDNPSITEGRNPANDAIRKITIGDDENDDASSILSISPNRHEIIHHEHDNSEDGAAGALAAEDTSARGISAGSKAIPHALAFASSLNALQRGVPASLKVTITFDPAFWHVPSKPVKGDADLWSDLRKAYQSQFEGADTQKLLKIGLRRFSLALSRCGAGLLEVERSLHQLVIYPPGLSPWPKHVKTGGGTQLPVRFGCNEEVGPSFYIAVPVNETHGDAHEKESWVVPYVSDCYDTLVGNSLVAEAWFYLARSAVLSLISRPPTTKYTCVIASLCSREFVQFGHIAFRREDSANASSSRCVFVQPLTEKLFWSDKHDQQQILTVSHSVGAWLRSSFF